MVCVAYGCQGAVVAVVAVGARLAPHQTAGSLRCVTVNSNVLYRLLFYVNVAALAVSL